MNKKQAVIIVSLLVLIVCAGYLATKVKSPYYVSTDDMEMGTPAVTTEDAKNVTKTSYFANAKLVRNQENAKTIETLKTIIDNKNTEATSRKNANDKYTTLALDSNNEKQIEEQLKAKGFEDCVCFIQNNKAKIYVKSGEKLTDEQNKNVQQTVLNVSQIRDIEIETKE